MLVATSVRRSVLAAIVIVASVLGTGAATTASIAAAGQARPAAAVTYSGHVWTASPNDTPWG